MEFIERRRWRPLRDYGRSMRPLGAPWALLERPISTCEIVERPLKDSGETASALGSAALGAIITGAKTPYFSYCLYRLAEEQTYDASKKRRLNIVDSLSETDGGAPHTSHVYTQRLSVTNDMLINLIGLQRTLSDPSAISWNSQ